MHCRKYIPLSKSSIRSHIKVKYLRVTPCITRKAAPGAPLELASPMYTHALLERPLVGWATILMTLMGITPVTPFLGIIWCAQLGTLPSAVNRRALPEASGIGKRLQLVFYWNSPETNVTKMVRSNDYFPMGRVICGTGRRTVAEASSRWQERSERGKIELNFMSRDVSCKLKNPARVCTRLFGQNPEIGFWSNVWAAFASKNEPDIPRDCLDIE